MTLTERCQAGEAMLEQVSAALLDPRPEVLDQCETDLEEVVALLENQTPQSDSKADLLRLRYKLHLLALQVQQGANLCQGWAQLGLSQGYTAQGKPAVPASESKSTFEV